MRSAAAPIVPKDTAKELVPQDTKEDFVSSLEVILASLRVWLIETLAILLDLFPNDSPITRAIGRELRTYLRDAEYDAKRALLGLALARLGPVESKLLPHHPPPGFALRRWRQSPLRFLSHGVFNARPHTLRSRIDRLRDILEDSGRWIARLLKRLRRGFDGAHAALAAPPLVRAAPLRPLAPALADSS